MKIKISSGQCPPYLTIGKAYDVIYREDTLCTIKHDNGNYIDVLMNCCAHLNMGTWEQVFDVHDEVYERCVEYYDEEGNVALAMPYEQAIKLFKGLRDDSCNN